MKTASRNVTVTTGPAADKPNGDAGRSFPGEQVRTKHVNMSTKIWVKVAMAIAYFLCVSVAAFILVIYYVFFWTPDAHYNNTASGNGTEPPNRTAASECTPRFG